MDDFASRLAKINDAIASAARKAGRDPAEIRAPRRQQNAARRGNPGGHPGRASPISAKTKSRKRGEKSTTLGRGVWHLIGHLQSNKAKDAVRLFDSIDSVDRARSCRGNRSSRRGPRQNPERAAPSQYRRRKHQVRLRARCRPAPSPRRSTTCPASACTA